MANLKHVTEFLGLACSCSKLCEVAAQYGGLEALKWARAQDPPFPWDKKTCEAAAMNGHLSILKWLRSYDSPCPWGTKSCDGAAANGHFDVLKWLMSQDPPCPWCSSAIEWAHTNGHENIVKWLEEHDSQPIYVGRCDSSLPWDSLFNDIGKSKSTDQDCVFDDNDGY